MINRRQYERMRFPMPLQFSGGKWHAQSALMKDISAGGVCLRTEEFIGVGSKLVLELYLPSFGETHTMVGKVVWNRELPNISRHEVGVQFTDLSEDIQNRIQRFVEKSLSSPS
ncbi:MAG: PilZ domain-containing protein [Candidatus Omnitrophota bacterium]